MPRTRALEQRELALVRLYEQAEAELVAQLAQDLEAGRLGTARYRGQRLAAIRERLSRLQDAAIPLSTELIGAAYIQGVTAATRAVRTSLPQFGSGIHAEALDLLADNLANGLNGAAEQLGRRIEDLYRRAGLELATQQIAQGQSLREATEGLVRALREMGLDAGPGGARTWRLGRYAEMVIRTNTTDAIVRGNVNAALEDGYDLVEVLVVDDEILCDICGPYAGQTFTLTEREGYERLTELPPFHPNCRCDLNILTSDPRE
jgi:hypothetical protein